MGLTLNPQQISFKENYTNPTSETFGNAYQSAVKAEFSKEYAKVITAPSKELEWVAEIVRDANRMRKAEKVLDKTLDMIDDEDLQKQKLAQDSAKFVASRLGKHKYSERMEQTGPEGEPLTPISKLDDDQLDKLISAVQRTVGGAAAGEAPADSGKSPEVRSASPEAA
jgi:hypothetical protein